MFCNLAELYTGWLLTYNIAKLFTDWLVNWLKYLQDLSKLYLFKMCVLNSLYDKFLNRVTFYLQLTNDFNVYIPDLSLKVDI